jgi:hypothetical protein
VPCCDVNPAEARESFLAVDHPLLRRGVPVPLQRDLGGLTFELLAVAHRPLDRAGSEVLLAAMQLRRTWDRHDPRLLRE